MSQSWMKEIHARGFYNKKHREVCTIVPWIGWKKEINKERKVEKEDRQKNEREWNQRKDLTK